MANKLANLLGKKPTQPAETKNEATQAEPAKAAAGESRSKESEVPASTGDRIESKPKGTKLGGLKIATVPITPSSKPVSRPESGKSGGDGAEKRASVAESQDNTGSGDRPLSLDDLESSEAPGTHRPTHESFSDEVPATQPIRDLKVIEAEADDETRKGMKQFVDLIDGVYSIMDDAEMLGNVIRSIMIELKDNPQYMKLVADDDVRAWIRGMRESMGLAKIKKEAKKTSRGGGGRKANVDLGMLGDLENML